HRVVTYPLLTPTIIGYILTKDAKFLDIFYSIRSMLHGFPMKNGLRIAKYAGMRIIFPSGEDPSFDDVWLREVYYPYLPKLEDTVVDVGAHMGFFTLKVAKAVKEVIAFEPDPYNFSFLVANIKYNNLSNVRPFNCALGNRDCDAFLKREEGYGRTRITEENTGQKARIKTLDSVVNELGISPDVIKIDTEGYEMKVLEGAMSTLIHFKPNIIIAAYHYQNESRDVVKYLSELGFKCLVYQVPLVLQKVKETYVYAV
ncbi:MAG: FkbM family methyltransferase, partial [Fervidobacterium sp.]